MANHIKILLTGSFRMVTNEKMVEKLQKARFKAGYKINSIMVFVNGVIMFGVIYTAQLLKKNYGIEPMESVVDLSHDLTKIHFY